ncbi:hypothetical protein Goari_011672, partial [Gossypium aridum]|nr:hypothetical protein [Gossypium aridum]
MGPSPAPMQETTPVVVPSMAAPPTGQYVPSYFGGSSSKPPIPRSKGTRWQLMQSTEGEEDERPKLEPQSE